MMYELLRIIVGGDSKKEFLLFNKQCVMSDSHVFCFFLNHTKPNIFKKPLMLRDSYSVCSARITVFVKAGSFLTFDS